MLITDLVGTILLVGVPAVTANAWLIATACGRVGPGLLFPPSGTRGERGGTRDSLLGG